MKKVIEVVNVESVNVKKYSSQVKGRIVNVSINGEIKNSLTECILSVKEGWNNKSKEAIALWGRVNSQLSKKGKCEVELDGSKFVFELVSLDK